ncbi:MAG TPA: HAMP domain-containing sensor histidine kinase [Sandaracinaceae bacterium]
MRAPSLRVLAAATLPAGALVVAAVAASLIGTTRTLRSSVRDLAQESRRERHVEQIESSLLSYHRLANSAAAFGDPDVAAERDRTLVELRRHLEAADALSETSAQRRELAAVRREIERYVEERAALEGSGSVADVVRRTHPLLDRALAVLDETQSRYDHQLTEAERRAAALASNAAIGGAVVIAVVLCALLGFALGLSRWVIEPLKQVLDGIARFRAGGQPVRLPDHGCEEIRSVAQALNETTTALAEQQKRQLAFVGGVAHDLRSPLSGLRMSAALVRESAPELLSIDAHARFVESVERHTERLSRMIDDILDRLRIESGELSLSMSEIELCELVRNTVEVTAHDAKRHRIVLELPQHVRAVADPLRVEQVVQNLLSNAIKYSPGGGRIDVGLEACDGEAVLTVRDHGVGIAPAELPHIFEPFRRAPGVGAPGAGLGLSVVQRIVAAHGGRVSVHSERGAGSTFRVHLPLSPPPRDATPAPERHGDGPAR